MKQGYIQVRRGDKAPEDYGPLTEDEARESIRFVAEQNEGTPSEDGLSLETLEDGIVAKYEFKPLLPPVEKGFIFLTGSEMIN